MIKIIKYLFVIPLGIIALVYGLTTFIANHTSDFSEAMGIPEFNVSSNNDSNVFINSNKRVYETTTESYDVNNDSRFSN